MLIMILDIFQSAYNWTTVLSTCKMICNMSLIILPLIIIVPGYLEYLQIA